VHRRTRSPDFASESKDALFAHLDVESLARARARLAELEDHFDLGPLRSTSSRAVYGHALARLAGLESLARGHDVPVGPDGAVRCVDAGCGDFHYANPLAQWLSRHGGGRRPVVLRGLELDAFGIYRDRHSRADHARARAAQAGRAAAPGSEVRFEVADAARAALPEQDVVTTFFPFVSAYASLRWGAPVSRLRPRRLLRRLAALVRPGGWLVVVDQTTAEHARVHELLAGLPLRLLAAGSFASDLVPDAERLAGQIGAIWVREAAHGAAASR
jgi:SAM-dependent methyltransferase